VNYSFNILFFHILYYYNILSRARWQTKIQADGRKMSKESGLSRFAGSRGLLRLNGPCRGTDLFYKHGNLV